VTGTVCGVTALAYTRVRRVRDSVRAVRRPAGVLVGTPTAPDATPGTPVLVTGAVGIGLGRLYRRSSAAFDTLSDGPAD